VASTASVSAVASVRCNAAATVPPRLSRGRRSGGLHGGVDHAEAIVFIQAFHGELADPDLWVAQVARWRADVRPRTTGFLGFTSGVTADSQMVTVARFESQQSAQVDSDLPEQGEWFAASSKAFAGEITFHDCPQVSLLLAGGSDRAGFVQVMLGRAKDPDALRALQGDMEAELRLVRPDLLGATVGWHGERDFVQTSYFTSEAQARANEATMAGTPLFGRFMAQIDGDLRYYDLTSPEFA
jgi:hypothetical protein